MVNHLGYIIIWFIL